MTVQEWKRKLAEEVSPEVYAATCQLALYLLKHVPADMPLGTATAGLMLAAMAYNESAQNAKALIREKV